uniref:T. congolense-specific, cell surface-expressed gene family n=1 Tax=Trypanosoma congolense (strain IL3000) TaxID=1068625 RepID=G0UMJ6_TRYCI|nr:hypothetical protein, unlikely [Trypanosoma congolense IL3000]
MHSTVHRTFLFFFFFPFLLALPSPLPLTHITALVRLPLHTHFPSSSRSLPHKALTHRTAPLSIFVFPCACMHVGVCRLFHSVFPLVHLACRPSFSSASLEQWKHTGISVGERNIWI